MDHEHLLAMLTRLKLTAIRDQLDNLLEEAARRELTLREALFLLCEREIARKSLPSGRPKAGPGGRAAHRDEPGAGTLSVRARPRRL